MRAFSYLRPSDVTAASRAAGEGTLLKAGGIDLLDRLKERVDEPDALVELGRLEDELRTRGIISGGGAPYVGEIGALVTLAALASDGTLGTSAPTLAEAAGLAASPQIRARATIAGNVMQHTRCGYYRHRSFPCLKRGDDACPVLADGAVQDTAAIFGNSACASAHPSSLAPVLASIGARAVVRRAGATGDPVDRTIVVAEMFAPPEKGRAGDTVLAPNDVIVKFLLGPSMGTADGFAEVRQKAAFDWALASCAVRVEWNGEVFGKKVVEKAHVWLGSVAPTPRRAEAAEKALLNQELTEKTIAAAAAAAVADATPLAGNTYKVELAKVVVRRALEQAAARE